MEALKRQASKLREQVAKQQQALLRQIGHLDPEAINADEAEIAQHSRLENFYSSTRAAKHLEKEMLHGIERFIIASSKQIEIERRFAQDCCKYQSGNHCSTSPLAEAALHVGASRNVMIKEKETLLGVFDEQVCKQLQALVKSAELEDARHLTRRYYKLWQDAEDQAAEVQRLRSKPIDGPKSGEHVIKLQAAEEKLDELKSRLKALGKEATSAMQSVEDQQQQMTFQQLVIMVNAERSFHRNVLTVLEKLHAQMMRMEQSNMSCSSPNAMESHLNVPETEGNIGLDGNKKHTENKDKTCFVAKVVIPFDAEAEGELSLSVDDTVVVQQVASGGWSKGECNGKTGWFPSPYVEKLQEVSKGKMTSTKQ
uniref:SH3 domain-containing protein n=1 Tax=Opuntia streptacantha TaxID=393608 RepID=A0A7C9CG06_OPUST